MGVRARERRTRRERSKLPFPVETILSILNDPSLSPADRAACCRVSKAFLSIARQALYQSLTFDIHNYCLDDECIIVDKSTQAAFVVLSSRPDLATFIKRLSIKVHSTTSWPVPKDDWEDFDGIGKVENPEREQKNSSMKSKAGLVVRNFDYSMHLRALLEVASNVVLVTVDDAVDGSDHSTILANLSLPLLEHLVVPDFPLRLVSSFPSLRRLCVTNPVLRPWLALPGPSPLQHLAIRELRIPNADQLAATLAAFTSLESFSFEYSAREEVDSPTADWHSCSDLSALASVHTVSLGLWTPIRGIALVEAPRITYPPSLRTLELRSNEFFSTRWERLTAVQPAHLLGDSFFATLPLSVVNLRVDLAPFDIPALCAFLRSPINLPNLETAAVLESGKSSSSVSGSSAGDGGSAAPSRSEGERKAQEEIVKACRQRGLKVEVVVQ
ncbi:hypothetical protein JCM6882_002169 [Rhodosporidiobolus microsporus]